MHAVAEALSVNRSELARQGFRGLVVHVESFPEALPRLEAAAHLARRLDATLLGIGAEMFQVYSDPNGALGGEFVIELEKIARENLGRAEANFKAHTAGLRAEWRSVEAMPVRTMVRLARGADLIVAGGAPLLRRDSYRTADTAELVLLSGKPVLVAPPAPAPFRGDAVVVAWKDTRECRRALADSLPFLRGAEEVVVLEVCEVGEIGDAVANTADVVQMLRRHGVAARAKAVAATAGFVADEIQNEARMIGADLVVAGAYGHSRLGEWAFGGVTRELIHAPERYVLLSH
jgi:nucleotide-binding universal stress UspA family protein